MYLGNVLMRRANVSHALIQAHFKIHNFSWDNSHQDFNVSFCAHKVTMCTRLPTTSPKIGNVVLGRGGRSSFVAVQLWQLRYQGGTALTFFWGGIDLGE